MSECCSQPGSAKKARQRKMLCPANQHEYVSVQLKTLLHNITEPWKINLKVQAYYFCTDPECDIAYFSEDGSVISKSQLRSKVFNINDNISLICHCFGVSVAQAKKNPEIKNFVIQQTKTGNCDCEIRNPSGRCCLKDFP